MAGPWVSDENAALLTDLYELTMLQSYFDQGMKGISAFDLFVRRLPASRNYLVAAGIEDVLRYLETFHFEPDALTYLRSLDRFTQPFLDYLRDFRFTGDVYALPEGTLVFGNEPILEVVAPIQEGQFVESFLLNQIHCQTLAASKAARVVTAAAGRTVIDFGLRRTQGPDTSLKFARGFYIGGIDATSNVLAGHVYGIPVAGTMAHSYVQAHSSEKGAFRAFLNTYPATILLVDTYDTLGGVRNVVQLARELGNEFRVRGIRLDSGDLKSLSGEARKVLDAAGLRKVQIFASSGLDEHVIQDLVAAGAPIDGFGVGAKMAVSADAPYLDNAYKLVEYDGQPRMKLSTDKQTMPGRKQIFRQADRDVIGLHDEELEGSPLLVKMLSAGTRTKAGTDSLQAARARARAGIGQLRPDLRHLEPARTPYLVEVSAKLRSLTEQAGGKRC
jgi:nicotinate phosphoribosyltransferase